MKITSLNGKSIETKMSLFEFQKKMNNSDNYIMLFDVWIETGYKEALQIEKKRVKSYG